MAPISIQLYSVREEAAKDFIGVLKKMAAIGYKGVEFAGLHGQKPEAIRKVLDDLGLVASSTHDGLPNKQNANEIFDRARALGYTMIISGKGPDDFKTLDGIKKAAAEFQAGAALAKAAGFQMGTHNHWWEFDKVGGRYGMEIFLELAPDVFSETDVYWACNFGTVDVPAFVAKYKSRIPILHIKDGPLLKDQPHTAVGKGKMKMAPIIQAADPKRLKWLVVELDACATDMMTAVADSYTYLVGQKLGEGRK